MFHMPEEVRKDLDGWLKMHGVQGNVSSPVASHIETVLVPVIVNHPNPTRTHQYLVLHVVNVNGELFYRPVLNSMPEKENFPCLFPRPEQALTAVSELSVSV
jgi:hypothetical protein